MPRQRLAVTVGYADIHAGIVKLLESARRASARAVNELMTATYWEIGRRIVEAEQGGKRCADYGARLIERLAADLPKRFGRWFGVASLELMRLLLQTYHKAKISESLIRNFTLNALPTAFRMRESKATTARDQDSVAEQKRGNQ